MKPIIAISMGDFNGVGPEVILKFLSGREEKRSTPLILGQRQVFDYYADQLTFTQEIETVEDLTQVKQDGKAYLLNCIGDIASHPNPGAVSRDAGKASILAVERGIDLCLSRQAAALVTAPISKEAIQFAGYPYPGHTELLVERTGAERHIMLLVNGPLRVGLVTTHIPLSDVAGLLSKERILKWIRLYYQILQEDFGINSPKIALLGVNPHAGDGGVIGKEEHELLIPAMKEAEQAGIVSEGPFAADGFFGSGSYRKYDGILAMYHDQGLIPFKTLSFGKGVNVTAGLPIVRTSPDHGTAFDIAGKGVASPDSFKAAYRLAIQLAEKRFNQFA
ncbi:MAG: 4-hydroxythreonine-4-phosphate dehydrogenase PdxA [Balneolaceae bacterium]